MSHETLEELVPGYVAQAHALGQLIIARALNSPDDDTAIVAYEMTTPDMPTAPPLVQDPERIRYLWNDNRMRHNFNVNGQIDSGRLMVEYRGSELHAWAYRAQLGDARWDIQAQSTPSLPKGIDWLSRRAADHLDHLITPIITFTNAQEPGIRMLLYHAFYRFPVFGILRNQSPTYFRQATAPRFTRRDEWILNRSGVAGLQNQKIRNMLALLRSIT